ncbi:tannase/feruloyl esterase family alpha/beta hydrolase [Pseudorhodoferax soli]|uniref:Feruloyl esterase n=1 Tax=Pseudorhodoferax soli TaxID=545864 RepID=A0A368XU34_9BURK|nr:tannase/feruloyl esterase family alpha/beta hydrolase [Pseudorhodoferax soli]RCW70548.1 feruloyl esterase [Pseudorhodoferax soli]
MNSKTLGAIASIALLATGCGGGDDATPDTPAATALAPDCTAVQRLSHANTVFKSAIQIDTDVVRSGTVTMPAHCVVTGEINPRTGVNGVRYSIGFELRLPLTWNGRFQFLGGGGVDGSIPLAYGFQRTGGVPALAQGAAVVTSDMGHTGVNGRDATFGLDQQARIDWGYNAMDKVTVMAKEVIGKFYGKAPQYSYYVGTSGGGRQGMMMAQRFPLHFDGIVSGAPILEQHLAQIGSMQMLQEFTAIAPKNANGQPILSKAYTDGDLKLIAAAVLSKCDALDGVADGLIENYPACTFDASELQCPGGKADTCLSAPQVTAFNKVMTGPRNSAGALLYPPAPWDTGIGEPEWRSDQIGTATGPIPNSSKFSNQSIKYVFMTPAAPDFDYLKFNFDTDPASMLASAAYTATNSTNYDGFKARKGKHIVYVGLADTLVNPSGVNRWYRELVAANGGLEATKQFARLFNFPGMGHSVGGAALDRFDPVAAIQEWVEKGVAPDFLVATGSRFPGRTRNICAYPQIARYVGSGSVDDAASFRCTAP